MRICWMLLLSLLLASCATTPHRVELGESVVVARPTEWVFGQVYQVRAFQTNSNSNRFPERLLQENGSLIRDRSPSDGVVLDQAQATALRRIMTTEGPVISHAKCVFRPHHALIFYGRDGLPVGSVDICFICSQYVTSAERMARYPDYVALEQFFRDIGLED